MLPEALSAFEEAEKARPDSAYIHLEHAQLLARLAQAARLPSAQTGYLRQATDEVGKARQLAPHNLDVLRGVGLVYLEMAGQDPAAAAHRPRGARDRAPERSGGLADGDQPRAALPRAAAARQGGGGVPRGHP